MACIAQASIDDGQQNRALVSRDVFERAKIEQRRSEQAGETQGLLLQLFLVLFDDLSNAHIVDNHRVFEVVFSAIGTADRAQTQADGRRLMPYVGFGDIIARAGSTHQAFR